MKLLVLQYMFILSRQTYRKALLYCVSVIVFWNALIAIRAYRFTHFANPKEVNTLNAGVLDNVLERFSGAKYYKSPIKNTPTRPFQNVQLTTNSGLKLEAWYMPANNSKGTALVFHGLGGNREQMLTESYALNDMGYSILTIDFRAHGNSEGSKCTLGKNEAEDIKVAYEYILSKGEKNIIFYGASMGAATIAACLHYYPEVQPNKVVLDMPFENYELLVERYFQNSKYPKQPTFTLFTFWASIFNNEWFFNMKPSEYVKSIKCPVLLQWGALDDLVPESSTQKLYQNIAAQKQLKIYKNSGHGSYLQVEPALWKQNIAAFLQ